MPPRFNIANVLLSPDGETFFRGFRSKIHAKGSLVCTGEGDENGVFVVVDGRLRVYLVGEEREISLFYLTSGDMFCMHSGCLVEATERTEVRFADIRTFEQKLQTCPSMAWGLIAILGRALTSCMRTIEDLMFHDIKQRIAGFFIDHANTTGRQTQGGVIVSVDFTVEEIANLIGSSRQTTSTALNSLIKEGYISRQGRGHYTIPNLVRLKAAADGDRDDDDD
ncbi:Crp/Fnr family transcriptional regulator [Rhodospirillum rubrum]|uniref:Transcriptional regulator, Crp/Fnr family n=2 Tax=Rhodospirillum rubrum TaxID=1085 RepID=Q2RUG3_RHORT|nr:Crp/Fnr family transcriptional regulator [Rhodospirillum rubrum]1FT9_A Chain A, CARBON MONOXIDE OXIDATION SYSTEM TRANSCRIPTION REGULATOR [Rhodospirillum rubrum]1FT9_B Chain B, CARBON MONOXIDE OXIDATION SYSTEM TRANSCRIPTION REGULATOR [Rhodospirillum rubrum]AAC45127.1 putative transcriptional activator; similar to cAMP-receptor (CAP, CRP) protein: PIR Accession Number A26049; similar to fnr (nirR) gene product encoded by GenBank Accession Number J01608; aspartic acid-rich C-terminus similar to 